MTDTLGSRKVFGVVTPSTNTVVQPEYDAMRPAGVVNHMEGMYIPDDPVGSDADFNELIRRIDSSNAERASGWLTRRACSRNNAATVCRLFLTRWWISRIVASLDRI